MHLTTQNLSTQFRRNDCGLGDLDLEVKPSGIGLLGLNRAGKSTLIGMLATITQLSAGMVHWNGADAIKSPDALRSTLGSFPQDFGIYPNLSALEFLENIAAIKGLYGKSVRRRIDELLLLAG
jgi:ABC-2 type transport system ATP-binding protein